MSFLLEILDVMEIMRIKFLFVGMFSWKSKQLSPLSLLSNQSQASFLKKSFTGSWKSLLYIGNNHPAPFSWSLNARKTVEHWSFVRLEWPQINIIHWLIVSSLKAAAIPNSSTTRSSSNSWTFGRSQGGSLCSGCNQGRGYLCPVNLGDQDETVPPPSECLKKERESGNFSRIWKTLLPSTEKHWRPHITRPWERKNRIEMLE